MTRTWAYPSRSSGATHTVTYAENGMLGCTCKGWQFLRPRRCWHIEDVAAREGFATEVRHGEYVFVTGLTAGPEIDNIYSMELATTDFEGMKASAIVAGKFANLKNEEGYLVQAQFDAVFGSGEWAMDEKLDGHRCQIRKVGNTVTTTLRSLMASGRTEEERTVGLPQHLIDQVRAIPFDVFLDGELAVPQGTATDVPALETRDELVFLAFDVLEACGESHLATPFAERRAYLETLTAFFGPSLMVVAQYAPTWANVEAIWARGGEGVILKRLSSLYRPGWRSPEWLKVKKLEHHTVTVTGFSPGSYGPTSVVNFVLDDGTPGSCKNKNQALLAATAADPVAYIGRAMVVQCQERTRGAKALRHPMLVRFELDHEAGEAER